MPPPSAFGRGAVGSTPPRGMYDLILFAPTPWRGRFQRPQQLARQFGRNGHRVYYIGVPDDDDPRRSAGQGGRAAVPVQGTVYVVADPGGRRVPSGHDRGQGQVVEGWLAALERLRDEEDIVHATLLVQLPSWLPLALRLRAQFGWRIVYDCPGRDGEYSVGGAPMPGDGDGSVRECDLIVTTTRRLCEQRRYAQPPCLHLPNGVDDARQHTWEVRVGTLRYAVRSIHPKVSIVIPVHNNLYLTQLCLESVLRHTTWPHVEIVVVDNGSTDGTPAYLEDLARGVEHLRILRHERNEGFARAGNRGLMAASGDYLVLLNNDTIVTRGWLEAMLRHLAISPEVGMVGPVTNAAGNEARIGGTYATIDEMEAFARGYTRAHAGRAFEVSVVGFFCAVIRRQVLETIGLLDERFGIGTFEDDDFCHRVRHAGFRLLCAEDAFVHHFHSATFKEVGKREYLEIFDANRARFERKWRLRWTPHRGRASLGTGGGGRERWAR